MSSSGGRGRRRRGPRLAVLAVALTLTGTLGACASGGGQAAAQDGRPSVVTSFYPLEFVAERVTGGLAQVSSLTKPGAEPHDLELTPQDVATVADADLVVYLGGFQPSVDGAVSGEGGDTGLDVAGTADLDLTVASSGGGRDPHFWLDPTRLATVARAVADRMGEVDPDHAARYAQNATRLVEDLDALDTEFKAGLADCASRDLVTSHAAFGYLARRNGLRQVGITGLSPETEPSPADLAKVTDFVAAHHVRTIYYETLVSPAVARTVAAETGARTDVLDPLEGLTDESKGVDYLAVMRANLASLEKGQSCR